MKKSLIFTVIVVTVFVLSGCQNLTRVFGGKLEIKLDPGQKLETSCWDGSSIDYQTRPMREGEHAEVHILHEKTKSGGFTSEVILTETERQ